MRKYLEENEYRRKSKKKERRITEKEETKIEEGKKNQQQNKCKIDRKGQIFVDYFSCFSFQIFTLVGVVLVDSTDYVRDAAGTRGVTEVRTTRFSVYLCELLLPDLCNKSNEMKQKKKVVGNETSASHTITTTTTARFFSEKKFCPGLGLAVWFA